MTNTALFVDLSNFYSHLLTSGIDDPRFLRDYFLYWLDFDRLAEELTGLASPVWVFYSGRWFGPKSNRIQDDYLDKYIERINRLKGVTARDVNIPGSQRESVSYRCEKCNYEGVATSISEKGVDASLTVHLFDTMDSWDRAYLLTGDADFVPVVASLRRRGKIVVGVGFSEVSSALVRECYDYIDLNERFLKQDVAAYTVFKEDGIGDKWFRAEVKLKDDIEVSLDLEKCPVKFEIGFRWVANDKFKGECVVLSSTSRRVIDDSERSRVLGILIKKFGGMMSYSDSENPLMDWWFPVSPAVLEGIKRRFDSFISSRNDVLQSDENMYTATHKYNCGTGNYERIIHEH